MLFMIIAFTLVETHTIYDADQFNETHVRVNNRHLPVVSCAYKNDSVTVPTGLFPIPILEYRNIKHMQSLFTQESPGTYVRYSCSNANVTCDCNVDFRNVMGYKCNCPYKTSFVRKSFNEKTKKFESDCEKFYSPCEKCHSRNTFKCLSTPNTTQVHCQCIKGYASSTLCYDQFNACKVAPEGSSLSGNEACLVHEKNTCVPYLGHQKYLCQCFYPNKENKHLGFPNCMGKKMTTCDSVLCINNGVCDETSKKRCFCEHGFSGRYCEITRYNFIGYWTPWTSCYPDCGNFGVRSSESICDGPKLHYCSGVSRKWERCPAISCNLIFLSRIENKTIQGLRYELAKMLSLTSKEYLTLVYILTVGGFTTGLLYIFITELFRSGY